MFKSKRVANKNNGFNPDNKLLQEAASDALFQIKRQVVGPLRTLCALQADDSKKQLLAMVDERCEQFTKLMNELSPPAFSEQDESSDHQASSLSQGSFRGM